MNKPQGNAPTPDRCPAELAPLLSLLLDGQLNAAQRDKLQALLRERADCRRYYLRFMNAHAGMHWTLGMARPQQQSADSSEDSGLELFIRFDDLSARALAELVKMEDAAEAEPVQWVAQIKAGKPIWQQWQVVIPSAIAALLAIAVILIVALPTNTTSTSPSFTNNNPVDPGPVGPALTNPVATLTAEHDAVWGSQPDEYLRPGSALAQRQRLTLTQGLAEIRTNDGAVAILEAPATIELINDNALHLHTGKLVGICETESSKGFLVRTAHMDITDLGTRFGIDADADATEVHVFEGEVQAIRPDSPDTQPTRLVANQSARTSADTDAIARIDHDADRFAALLPTTIQLPGTGQGLAVGEVDPNWQVVASDGQPLDTPQLLRVTSNRIYNGQFANDPATSQWLSFTPAEQTGDEHTYQVRTALDLPQDISENGVRLRLAYMADNALRSVTVNGHRVVLPEAQWLDGRNGYAPFQRATIQRHLVPGMNTFTFELVNIRGNGVLSNTGLRVAWLLSGRLNQPEQTHPNP